jgi:anaerobic selenocysteine-containing dehydrogenase
LALRPGELEGFAAQLAGIVSGGGAAQGSGANGAWISALARDLLAHRGASAVIAGEAQSPAVHALAHAMNAALGNVGTTVIHTDPIEVAAEDQIASLGALVSAMDAGKVKLLLMLGGNPVYNAPADFGFADKLKKIENAIHVTLHPNETSVRTRWVVPQRHFLED